MMIDHEIDRRRFLRRATAGAIGAWGGPGLVATKSRGDTASADVLIIGAGMAGVAAGSALRAAGLNPIVLEGRADRIGGRIWSSYAWADAPVDLGASWLTHQTINPLAKLAAESGIALVPSELLNLTLSEADGRILPDDEVQRLFLLFLETYADVKLIADQRIAQRLPDLPASDAFARVIAQQQIAPATLRKLGFFLNLSVKEPNASPLSDLSLKYWDDDLVFVQLALSVVPGGYVQLVHRLAAGLDIRMGHVVSEIAYGPQGVIVTTNQGQFSAPNAIVTLPHGVLSGGSVAFSPPLPAWKQGAIRRLHTGVSNKTYLRFPSRFWNPEPDTLGRIAETSEARWSTWINFYKYEGIPLLMAFNHSDYGLELESMTDTEVTDAAMAVLRKQYGRGIPDPIGMQRSRWASDPFSQGTIAHVPPGASGNDYALMGTPVGPIGFAGDSTTADFPTLVFGAYLTGMREASRILVRLGLGNLQPVFTPGGSADLPGGGSSAGTSTIADGSTSFGKAELKSIINRRRRRRGGGGSGDLTSVKRGHNQHGGGLSSKPRKGGGDDHSKLGIHTRANNPSSASSADRGETRSAPPPGDRADGTSKAERSHNPGPDHRHPGAHPGKKKP